MNSSDAVVAGNVYDKYHTRNLIERRLMTGFWEQMQALLDSVPSVRSVLEVGCGEGHVTAFLQRMKPRAEIVGVDIDPGVICEASVVAPGAAFAVADIYALPWEAGAFDLVVAPQVLEHIERPGSALTEIRRVARRYLLASVPNEPIWRVLNVLAGRYVLALGNTPGHMQHWSKVTFREFIESEFAVIEVRTPLPWTMILAEKKPRNVVSGRPSKRFASDGPKGR